jgi:L-alanine-DL-glutamate epimerase-like enolase superfamily enzyme
VETDDGIIGLGEMGGVRVGRGQYSCNEELSRWTRSDQIGRDAFPDREPHRIALNNRTQILAALEFACLDIIGQSWGVPVSEILGGRLRERIPFASYLFFRYANPPRRCRRDTNTRTTRSPRAHFEGSVRVHIAQDKGRCVSSAIRTRVLPCFGK